MRLLTYFLCTTISVIGYAQNFDLVAGINSSSLRFSDQYYSARYVQQNGFNVRFGFNRLPIGNLRTRIDVTLEKYGGEFDGWDLSSGGSIRTKGEMQRTNLGVGWFPLNVVFRDNIRFTGGFTFSGLLVEKVEGVYTSTVGGKYEEFDISKSYDRFTEQRTSGARIGIATSHNVTNRYAINLQYTFEYGLSREFAEHPQKVKGSRHCIAIGLQTRKKPVSNSKKQKL